MTRRPLAPRFFIVTVCALAGLLLASCGRDENDAPRESAAAQAAAHVSIPQPTMPQPTPYTLPTPAPEPAPSHKTQGDPSLETPPPMPDRGGCEASGKADFAGLLISRLTDEEKIGQLLMPRLPWQATSVSPLIIDWMERYPVGGIILFGDNVSSISQVQVLTADLQAAQGHVPLFIATDEEGGRVSRIGRLFDAPIPPAFTTGKQGDPGAAYENARVIGQRLAYLGINMNFAPVADVWTNPANAVIADRAFSDDPHTAGEMVAAFVRGLQAEGIHSVIKHFPGHGDTYEDSHYRLALYPHDRKRFDAAEALPFAQGIAAGADGVMVGHISTPQLQKKEPTLYWMGPWLKSGTLPATFSDFWLQDVLRGEMGFDGLIVTDALDMRALTDHFTVEQIAVGAFVAGADILLMPAHTGRAFDALLDAYREGVFTTERLHESLRRILSAKEGL